MISIKSSGFIARGQTRACYQHPDDESRCIKIDAKKEGARKLTPSEKEALYYQKIARLQPQFPYDAVPEFHGWVETNLGKGAVFDLIQDEVSGRVSKSLREYLEDFQEDEQIAKWDLALEQFKASLIKHCVLARDLGAHNICVKIKRDGSLQFIAIDGVGHRDFIPLVDVWPWLARRKLNRQFYRKHLQSMQALLTRYRKKSHR